MNILDVMIWRDVGIVYFFRLWLRRHIVILLWAIYNQQVMASFDKIYQSLLKDIMKHGVRDINSRTGHETAALPGLSFSIDLQKEGFPLLSLRKIPIKLFVAEQVWF